MSTDVSTSEFGQFCDFVIHLRDAGAKGLTPEQSVEEFRRDQEKLRRWHEGNAISEEQARLGLAKPLDDEAVIARVRARLAEQGIFD